MKTTKKIERYLFLKMKITVGEYEFLSKTVHIIPENKTAQSYSRDYASSFYDKGKMYDGNRNIYEFFAGDIIVGIVDFKQISKKDFDILKEYI